MGKPKTETRIKREREKLAEVFAKMDENKRKTAEKLMDNAAFMAVTLEDLRDSINENGCVSEYQNGENQKGTKKSPEVEVYNTMIKNYTTVIKTLCDLLPESNGEMDDGGCLPVRRNADGDHHHRTGPEGHQQGRARVAVRCDDRRILSGEVREESKGRGRGAVQVRSLFRSGNH